MKHERCMKKSDHFGQIGMFLHYIYILVSPAAGPAEAGPRKAVLGVCAVSPVDAS